jgi:hypothetical protein
MKTDSDKLSNDQISRKEALRKAGKYAAFTAAAAMIMLAPKAQAADSGIDPAGKDWGNSGYTPPAGRPSPFTKPDDPKDSPSGLKDSPWK